MADFILTPNMGLPEPIVGVTTGTAYATYINQSLTLIDRHDHTPGNGVQITPAALNIDATVDFQINSAINLVSANFVLQSIDPVLAQTLYVKDGSETVPLPDLWYFDGNTHIQITSNGQTATTLANLPGQSYSSGTFTWRQGAGSTTPAVFDLGSIIIRPTTAGATTGVELIAPSSANYNLTFPNTLPGATSLMALDSAGNITAPFPISGGLNASVLTPGSITETQMGPLSVGTPELIDGSVTPVKKSALGQQVSGSVTAGVPNTTQNIGGLAVTITTTGRPVFVGLIGNLGSAAAISAASGTTHIFITRDVSTIIMQQNTGVGTDGTSSISPSSAFWTVDLTPAAGTHTYQVMARYDSISSGGSTIENTRLIAYEL